MTTEPFKLLLADRRSGRTTQAFNWVSHGVEVNGYPGWSRVLLIPTLQRFEHHRKEWWSRLYDYDHRVYTLEDWNGAFGVRTDVELCIDDLELAIMMGISLNRLRGRLVCATFYGAPWEAVDFSPAELARVEPD